MYLNTDIKTSRHYDIMRFEISDKKRCDEFINIFNHLKHFTDKNGREINRLFTCSNCVSCENKKIVFRTRDANSSINIMNLASCWIYKQERPLCFQISSFTSSNNQKEEEKVRPS